MQLPGGVTVAGKSITINGTGVSDSSGALKSVGTGTATRSVLTIANAANLTFGSGTTTRFGTIAGNLAIAKGGAGTLTLAGTSSNSYTGGTTITAGTLAAQANNALGTGDVTIVPAEAGNTVLDLSSASVTTGAIADAATLSLASDTGTATPRYAVVAFGASTLNETVNGLLVDGVAMAPRTYRAADLPNFITGGGSITVLNTVPEPASAAAAGLAAAGLLAARRRRRA